MAINDSKTTKTGNRDTNQHRNFIEDLVNLLFCVDSTEFTLIITEKPYPKYHFQPHQTGRKSSSKTNNRAQNSINQSTVSPKASEPLYEHHTHFKASTKNSYRFCTPKSTKPPKKQDLRKEDLSISIFRFNSNQNIDIERPKKSRRDRKKGKQTFWYCKECQKHVCKEGNCWSQAHK